MSYFGIPIRNGIGIGLRSYVGLESRTPAWTPAQLTTALWFDAADANTITLNGSNVSQWADKSGNGRHATQATGANQPAYTINGMNGKPALTFNGTSSRMASSLIANSASETIIAALNRTGTPPFANSSTILGASATPGGRQLRYENNGFLQFVAQTVAVRAASASVAATNAPAIIEMTYNASTTNFYSNGVSIGSTNVSPGLVATTTEIGVQGTSSSEFFVGQMAEIIICQSVLSTTDRQLIEGYLAWKWGTQASLPADHPYKSLPPTA